MNSLRTALCLLASVALPALAQTVSPVQSPARPFKLDIAAPVYMAGSDERSAAFQKGDLPTLIKFIGSNLGESRAVKDIASVSLNPSKLKLETDADVRVYFVGEGAGYLNTLGVNFGGIGLSGGKPLVLFPNASSRVSWLGNTNDTRRTTQEPLLPGDFVDLGTVGGGQSLDFFLIANGASSPNRSNVWTADQKYNSDGFQHLVSFAVQDSPYLLLGFEDLPGGGDRDYNDLVFAVDIGYKNVQVLASPEPGAILTFLVLAGIVLAIRRRMQGGMGAASPA